MREFGDLCGFGWIGCTLGREVRETLSGIAGSGVRFAFPEVEAFQDCLDVLRLGDLDGGTITNDVHAQEPRESAEIFNIELDEEISLRGGKRSNVRTSNRLKFCSWQSFSSLGMS